MASFAAEYLSLDLAATVRAFIVVPRWHRPEQKLAAGGAFEEHLQMTGICQGS